MRSSGRRAAVAACPEWAAGAGESPVELLAPGVALRDVLPDSGVTDEGRHDVPLAGGRYGRRRRLLRRPRPSRTTRSGNRFAIAAHAAARPPRPDGVAAAEPGTAAER